MVSGALELLASILSVLKEVTAVWAWAGVKDKRETTDPELVEHQWDNDQAEDCGCRVVACAAPALVEMSGCGHDIMCNSH